MSEFNKTARHYPVTSDDVPTIVPSAIIGPNEKRMLRSCARRLYSFPCARNTTDVQRDTRHGVKNEYETLRETITLEPVTYAKGSNALCPGIKTNWVKTYSDSTAWLRTENSAGNLLESSDGKHDKCGTFDRVGQRLGGIFSNLYTN